MQSADTRPDPLEAPSRLVASTRVEFRRAALDLLDRALKANCGRVVVDLAHTIEIDASELGVLVLLQKRARERMVAVRLQHTPEPLKQMLALTKLDYLFDIES